MLELGHAGITLGVATLLAGALQVRRLHKIRDGLTKAVPVLERSSGEKVSWFAYLGRCVDIRLLLVGSLLPDIIDKPVGLLWLRETLNNGRIFCHTLLFLLIITLIGVYLYRTRHRNWLMVLSGGVFTHLIFDEMWLTPKTLFWPLYGLAFERLEDLTCWLSGVWYRLVTEPAVCIPEIIGVVILVWFTVALLKRRKLYSFLTNGQV